MFHGGKGKKNKLNGQGKRKKKSLNTRPNQPHPRPLSEWRGE
ncbi:hypothetical protein HMPREF0973_02776 [Prevotella veroralis F0319]|uniref:Uncharacterized protein n=1 Tax=Prevotella veroralis F0319 TaxID=649761 RepID=C9MT07_9BACT|nr:hypothetical protein HMPREF0973_02776 [Prevotella veroralis F0319]